MENISPPTNSSSRTDPNLFPSHPPSTLLISNNPLPTSTSSSSPPNTTTKDNTNNNNNAVPNHGIPLTTHEPLLSSSSASSSTPVPVSTEQYYLEQYKQLSVRLHRLEEQKQECQQNILRMKPQLEQLHEKVRKECTDPEKDNERYRVLIEQYMKNKVDFYKACMNDGGDKDPSTFLMVSKPLLTVKEYIDKVNKALDEPVEEGNLTVEGHLPVNETNPSVLRVSPLVSSTSTSSFVTASSFSSTTVVIQPPKSRTGTTTARKRYLWLQNRMESLYVAWGKFIVWLLLMLPYVYNSSSSSSSSSSARNEDTVTMTNRENSSSSSSNQYPSVSRIPSGYPSAQSNLLSNSNTNSNSNTVSNNSRKDK